MSKRQKKAEATLSLWDKHAKGWEEDLHKLKNETIPDLAIQLMLARRSLSQLEKGVEQLKKRRDSYDPKSQAFKAASSDLFRAEERLFEVTCEYDRADRGLSDAYDSMVAVEVDLGLRSAQ